MKIKGREINVNKKVLIVVGIIAIIVVAVVIGFQFNRTKNLYNKKYDENKDEFRKDQEQ